MEMEVDDRKYCGRSSERRPTRSKWLDEHKCSTSISIFTIFCLWITLAQSLISILTHGPIIVLNMCPYL